MPTLNRAQTLTVPPADIAWKVPDVAPSNSVAEATLGGGEDRGGAYLVLMKWWPHWGRDFSRPRCVWVRVRLGQG